MKRLEELFIRKGIFSDPSPVKDFEVAYEDVTSRTNSSLQQDMEELLSTIEKVRVVISHIKQ